MEVAGLVRAGMMAREEGLESLADLGSDKTARACAARLGFSPDYADARALEHQVIFESASS
jgi:hypothetical protein